MIKKVAHCLLFLLFYGYLLLLLIVIFSFCGEGGWVASNFVICVYMLILQFHPVFVMRLEILSLHLTPHLKKSVI